MRPGRIADRFELDDDFEPAHGGAATVYRGRDLHTGRRVAIKLVRPGDPRSRDRFRVEWQLLLEMKHPGIVEHVAHGEMPSGLMYMVMEWLEGEDLAARLGRGRLSLPETLALGRQIASALALVHQRDVVHRDVKPANIFLPGMRLRSAKLLDFGIARVEHRRVTGTGAFVGTPGYLAPEQARGGEAIDARTDVFALGLVLYECLTGMPVYSGTNPMSLLVKVAVQPPPRLEEERPDLPSDVCELLACMIASKPDERLANGAAVMRAIDSLSSEEVSASWRELPRVALTDQELELLSVVLTSKAGPTSDTLIERTLRAGDDPELTPEAQAILDAARVPTERLLDGSRIATVRARAAADEQASIAAHVALALARALPSQRVVLATGRAPVHQHQAVGDVIERAASLLTQEAPDDDEPRVGIDELTAGLLQERFVVREEGERLALLAARDVAVETTTLHGRDTELRTFAASWAAGGQTLVVTGGAGLGKSALLGTFAGMARGVDPDVTVLSARADPMGAGRAFGVLADLVKVGMGLGRGEPPQARYLRLLERVEERMPEREQERAIAFLSELVGARPSDDGSVTDERVAAAADPALKGDLMRRVWEAWLVAERARGPVLLLVDDAQFADAASLAAIASAVRREAPHRATAAVAARALPAGVEDGIGLELAALDEPTARRLAEESLGALATERDVGRVVAQAGGNPSFVIELARAVVAGEDELPSSLVAIAQSQLASLPPEARRALRAAAPFGMRVEEEGMRRLLARDAPLERGIAVSLERGLLARDADAYRFTSAVLREAAYASLTPSDRKTAHELAARWLSERGEVDPLVLAEHWSRSGSPALAVEPIVGAMEMAIAGHDWAGAAALAQRARELGARGAVLGRVCLLLSEACRWDSDLDGSAAAVLEALALLPERTDDWFAAISLAIRMYANLGNRERVLELVEPLLAVEDRPEHRVPLLRALGRSAMATVSLGLYDEAAMLRERLEAAAEELRSVDAFVGSWIFAARAAFAHHQQDFVEYRQWLLESADAFSLLGDRRMEAVQRTNGGYALNEIGAPGRAEVELERAVEVADDLGLMRLGAAARQNLAVSKMRQGDVQSAVELLREAEARFVEIGDVRFIGSSHFYLAEAYRMLGQRDRARELADAAQSALSGAPPLRASALALLAQIQLDLGEVRGALANAEAGYALFKSLGQLESREELVLLVRAKALAASGQQEYARQAIEVAARRLQERAGRIEEPRWRDRFLNGSPERVETLVLRDEWH